MKYLYPVGMFLKLPGVYYLGNRIYNYISSNRNTERCTEDNCVIGFSGNTPDESKMKLFKNLDIETARKKGMQLLFISVIFFQGIISCTSPLINNYLKKTPFQSSLSNVSKHIEVYSSLLLGITHHGVFTDGHFSDYNHIIKVEYLQKDGSKILLPIINNDGMPSDYLKGFNWVKWTFRVNSPYIKQNVLENGIKNFTAYWLHNNKAINSPLERHIFVISVKKIEAPQKWEKDFLKNQIKKPWIIAGTVEWNNKNFTSSIDSVEAI